MPISVLSLLTGGYRRCYPIVLSYCLCEEWARLCRISSPVTPELEQIDLFMYAQSLKQKCLPAFSGEKRVRNTQPVKHVTPSLESGQNSRWYFVTDWQADSQK